MDDADWITTPEADRAVRFVENLSLVGDYSGTPFRLRNWQERIVRQLFGTLDADTHLRQYRSCFLALPRKSGKTAFCASLLLYSLLGTGKHGQEVYSCAASRDQASILFRYAAQMVRADKYLSRVCLIYENTKRIVCEKLGNSYTALSADAHTAHGLSPSTFFADELHAWRNRELWDVMVSGQGAREAPLKVVLTTAGTDRTSVCYQEWDYARKVRDGLVEDPTYLPVLYAADPEDVERWDDPAVWRKAMPALGDWCPIQFIEQEARKAKELPSELGKFLRLYLNIWTQADSRWLPRDKWDACGSDTLNLDDYRGQTAFLGVDVARTTDVCAIALVIPGDKYVVFPYFFAPTEGAERREHNDRVPYLTWARQGHLSLVPGYYVTDDFIFAKIAEIAKTVTLKKVHLDPWNSTSLATRLQDEGLPVEFLQQGFKSLSAPTKRLEQLVLSGDLQHPKNPVLDWMIDNVTLESDASENIKVSKERSRERVDGVVAIVDALAATMMEPSAGPSVYESRGIVWF